MHVLRPHLADDFLGRLRRALQHCVDALLGRQDDRQEIGPTVLLEQPPQVVLGIGRQQSRRRALERRALQILVIERAREALDHALHERPLRDRIDAVDVGAKLCGRAADDGLRHEHVAHGRHAGGECRGFGQARENMRADWDRRYALLL